jgi:cytochrome b561
MRSPPLARAEPSAVPPSYDPGVIILHWATALLVVSLFALAEIWSFLPNGHLSAGMQSLHVSLGMSLATVLVLRIVWRTVFAKPIPPAAHGLQHIAATGMHLALYFLLICQIVLGFLDAWTGGAAAFFGLFVISSPFKIGSVASGWIYVLHYYNAWLIICLAGAHAAVALAHHYVLRDDVLYRMLPLKKDRLQTNDTATAPERIQRLPGPS